MQLLYFLMLQFGYHNHKQRFVAQIVLPFTALCYSSSYLPIVAYLTAK